jgi:SAM-dependent methyltransferase
VTASDPAKRNTTADLGASLIRSRGWPSTIVVSERGSFSSWRQFVANDIKAITSHVFILEVAANSARFVHARDGARYATQAHMAACHLAALDDVAFDERLPASLQVKSAIHFTPVEVARRAAALLAPVAGMTVLDVGAGPGKFCLVAAHAVSNARFVGVEVRGHLVRVANRLAAELGVPNVEFVHGDAFDLDWSTFDAFYLYNPFAEHLLERAFLLDDQIERDPNSFEGFVNAVCERLAEARVGTRVVTYHGFGACPPSGFHLVSEDAIGSDRVELWIKFAPCRSRASE